MELPRFVNVLLFSINNQSLNTRNIICNAAFPFISLKLLFIPTDFIRGKRQII